MIRTLGFLLIATLYLPLAAQAQVSGTCASTPDSVAVFGRNLVVNGDAESGPAGDDDGTVIAPPGWCTTDHLTAVHYGASGGLPAPDAPGPSDRGASLFAGGPSSAASSASQVIDVSAAAPGIDTGRASYALSAYLGGFSGQDDGAVLTVTFRPDGSGSPLGSTSIGPVTQAERGGETGLLPRATQGTVPPGTRTIDVLLQMTRSEGAYNDGYADNLSLILTSPS